MLRLRLSGLLVLLLAAASQAQEQKIVPASHDWVEFDGQRLYFAYVGENQLMEYIPAGETLNAWTRLASVRDFPNVNDPLAFARGMVEVIKKNNPAAQSAIVHNPKTDSVVLDFITWPANTAYVEFNVFRFEKNNRNGIVAHQYAVRDYSNQIEFLRGLATLRRRLQEEMVVNGIKSSPPSTARR